MSNWERQTALEDAFNEMHGIKPQVYRLVVNKNEYKIKLVAGELEAVLTEVMKKGLTDKVTLECGGVATDLNSMYAAEVEAVKFLRG